MADIVRTWGLEAAVKASLIKICENHEITDERFPHLTQDLIKEMIPAIGFRLEFLKKWTSAFGQETHAVGTEKILSEIGVNEPHTKMDFEISEQEASSDESVFTLRTKTMNITNILKKSPEGRTIIKTYTKTKSLNKKRRGLLVEIILADLMSKTKRLTNEDLDHIATAIVTRFPTESKGTYFVPAIPKNKSGAGKSIIARGKLVDKHRNRIRRLKQLALPNTHEQNKTTDTKEGAEPTEEISEAIDWLKKHSSPWEVVLAKWKLTTEYRRNILKKDRTLTPGKIFELWPILKHPNAPVLLEEDFSSLDLPAKKLTAESWGEFKKKILAARPPKRDDRNAMDLFEIIESLQEKSKTDGSNPNDESPDGNENGRIVLELKLLSHLLPPKSRFRTKKNQWKPSITESKDSMVVHTPLLSDTTKVQEDKQTAAASLGVTVQPYIIVVGPTISKVTELFVCIDKNLYAVSTTLEAIDACYKAFHTLDLHYPLASSHLWILIQRLIYGYESSRDKIPPHVTEMMSDISAQVNRSEMDTV